MRGVEVLDLASMSCDGWYHMRLVIRAELMMLHGFHLPAWQHVLAGMHVRALVPWDGNMVESSSNKSAQVVAPAVKHLRSHGG